MNFDITKLDSVTQGQIDGYRSSIKRLIDRPRLAKDLYDSTALVCLMALISFVTLILPTCFGKVTIVNLSASVVVFGLLSWAYQRKTTEWLRASINLQDLTTDEARELISLCSNPFLDSYRRSVASHREIVMGDLLAMRRWKDAQEALQRKQALIDERAQYLNRINSTEAIPPIESKDSAT